MHLWAQLAHDKNADDEHVVALIRNAMEAIGRPFVSEPAMGRPRHRLMFDRRNSTWYLDTDEDGDGRFEMREKYRQ